MNISELNSRSWYSIWFGVTLTAALLIGFNGSLSEILNSWLAVELESTSHGFLVLGCAVYLLMINRDSLRKAPITPSPWAGILLATLSILWLTSVTIGVRTVELALMPVLLGVAVYTCFGLHVFRIAFIPVLLLLFAMPIWWPALPYLVDLTTSVTHALLRLIGKPVFTEDNFLHLPGGSFKVDDSCAGLRYLTVSVALSLFTISAFSLKARQALLLTLGIVALSLIANWLRVLTIVLVGDYTDMQHSLVNDHVTFGWIVYAGIVLLPLFFYTSSLNVHIEPESKPSDLESGNAKNRKFYLALAVTFVAFLIGPWFLRSGGSASTIEFPGLAAPEIDSWSSELLVFDKEPSSVWKPNFQGATDQIGVSYTSGDVQVELHIVFYASQTQDAELINVNNTLTEGPWVTVPESQNRLKVRLRDDSELLLATLEVSGRNRDRKKLWYWYEVGGYRTDSEFLAKFYQLPSMVLGRNDAALVVLAQDCALDCDSLSEPQAFLDAASEKLSAVWTSQLAQSE